MISRMGTIASSLLLGAATAGGASLVASTLGGSNLGAGGGAGAFMAGAAIAGAAGAGIAIGVGAARAGATGAGCAELSTAALTAPAEIIRVNSPGPELALAPIGGAEAGGKIGSGGVSRGTCDKRWISLVTLPGSTVECSAGGGAEYEGIGSGL
jgi:hypothetical protein